MNSKFCTTLKLLGLSSTLLVSQFAFAGSDLAKKCDHYYKQQDWRAAYQFCQEPAQKGEISSQIILGDLYSHGKGTSTNYTKSIHWYEKAAKSGNEYAMTRTAYLYEKIDRPENAFLWYRAGAKNHNTDAMFRTAQFYENGYGVNVNKKKAFHWYREAARQNHYQAQWITATLYHDGAGTQRDMKKAIYWYKRSANNGVTNSQYQMGVFHQNGDYLAKNDEEALHYFTLAAKNGHPKAKAIVAKYSLQSRAQGSTKTAAELYRQAAVAGDTNAQYQYGKLVYAGVGTTQDKEQAVNWLGRAAETGHVQAQSYLARIYLTDPDIADNGKAVKWLTKATESNDSYAQYQLGRLYLNGKGVQKDTTYASQLFARSARTGNADSQAYLGLSYHQGIGVAQNYHLAQKWYRKAAFKGNTLAQYNLATLYKKGLGVRQDNVRAYSWMSIAAASGFPEAQTAQKIMSKTLTAREKQASQSLSPVLVRAQH